MILFGASGHGKVIADILMDTGVTDIEFWDDAIKEGFGFAVRQTPADASSLTEEIIVSVGVNAVRKKIVKRLGHQHKYMEAIHPSSVISKRTKLGHGTVVMGGAVINIDSKIGRHCIINTSAVVDHDCVLEDFVHISPNATLCGNVTVGEGTHIGAGSVVIQGIKIGKWCEIGAGAVVIRDVPDHATVVGNPAKVIKYKTP